MDLRLSVVLLFSAGPLLLGRLAIVNDRAGAELETYDLFAMNALDVAPVTDDKFLHNSNWRIIDHMRAMTSST